MMMKSRPFFLVLLCVALLCGSGCRNKGIPCPKPPGKRSKVMVQGKNEQGLESVKVQTGKNGRVKKRGGLF